MLPEPHVSIDVRHRLGTLSLNVKLDLFAPWTVLFGPSGSGKSTLMRCIAGLVRPNEGCVKILNQIVSGPKIWVPAHRRPARWAPQQPALFPRKTVAANLALARLRGGTRVGPDQVASALDTFGIRALASAYPAELSGGQRQQISVIRAVIGARGSVLLLDEPFSGLDATIRDSLRAGVREWLGDTPVVSVTHDVGEAFLLQAEVVRLAAGRVVAQGPAEQVLALERARLLGMLQ